MNNLFISNPFSTKNFIDSASTSKSSVQIVIKLYVKFSTTVFLISYVLLSFFILKHDNPNDNMLNLEADSATNLYLSSMHLI